MLQVITIKPLYDPAADSQCAPLLSMGANHAIIAGTFNDGGQGMYLAADWQDFEVLDTGDGMKLERWGDVILARPDP